MVRIKMKISRSIIICVSIILSMAAFAVCTTAAEVRTINNNEKKSEARHTGIMRGLYVPNKKSRDIKYIQALLDTGTPEGINMLVMDVHSYGSVIPRINTKVIEYCKNKNVYCVARVVCFQDGLDRMPVPAHRLKRLNILVEKSAKAGFHEVQLDYIRFKDGGYPYSLVMKYRFIEELLAGFKKITDSAGIKLSADVFGRIVYNRNDYVGQKLEVFAKYTDVIYPMLYPSHFTGDRVRMANPGETVKEGTMKGLDRLRDTGVKVVPYIQAFDYHIRRAGVSLPRYVELQVRGVESTKARGWVAWNAYGDYRAVMKALRDINGKSEKSVNTARIQ